MAAIIFLIVTASLFSVIGVIVLLARVSRQEDLLREYGERLDRAEKAPYPSVGEAFLPPAAKIPPMGAPPKPPLSPVTPPMDEANFPPAFLRGVNLWAAGGILLLLAGFATLVTHLAHRGFFTVEMGIAAAALCGLVMLVLGWCFRKKRPLYFLPLQGGGIGILYFSVFAAARFTAHLSPRAGLVFMSLLVPTAIALALVQNSQVLALVGFLGGFAVPPLMAWGGGNQVFLFAYYLVLDLGVLCIGFFRRWNPLNLLALLCCFIPAAVWTMNYYTVELFWSVEPFFLAYFLIFTVLSFRGSALKIASNFDMALILGTPILAAPLQWKVFEPVAHGHALACLCFSAFYIAAAFVLWKRRRAEGRLLREACLDFGVLLANLAIPLELSPGITSAVWAAEGLVVFFTGLRLKSGRITVAALALHAAGAIAFFFKAGTPEAGTPVYDGVLSAGFTGSLVIALSALAMVYGAERLSARPRPALSLVLAVWGFLWWFGGWWYGISRGSANPGAALFLLCSLSAPAAYGASRRLRVPLFRLGMIPSLAGGFLVWFAFFSIHLFTVFTNRPWVMLSHNYFTGAYGWAWLVFFAVQGVLIVLSRRELREDVHGVWILIAVLVSLGVLTSSGRAVTVFRNLAPAWTSFAGLLPVFAAMAGISLSARRLAGKADGALTRARLVFYILPLLLSAVLGLWFLVTLFFPGNPAPLPFYIPILNPLDLEELLCLVVFLLWQSALMKRNDLPVLKKWVLAIIVDGMVLLYAVAAVARGAHFYGGIAYRDLAYSDVFHLCLFILLALYGMGHIIGGNRLSQRPLWIAGAVLMIADTAKFLLFDQASAGAAARVASFFLAGLLFLVIGWAAPLPPSSGPRPGKRRDG